MTEPQRPNPDTLLAALQKEEAGKKRGQIKVFLGMCPGVGKTYAMLEAAQRELKAGRDVLIGYVETHGRKETDALATNFPAVARMSIEYRGVTLAEMNLDAVLARRPQLALVDELAHTNVPGSRHPKRWQDIQELRDAGIDVFTTLNVQHVESRADTVKQITGAEIRETVPDSVLDDAVLELVDLPPRELLQRLQDGKVYVSDRATAAIQNFFREANLNALRELALRLVADHVGEDTVLFRRTETAAGPWKTGNRLLVAVGPSPLSEPLIRWTRRMADELRCPWLAVHVEGPQTLSEAAQARLSKNLDTARELGGEVITTTDEDLARGLLRIARERNVTLIVLGKPSGGGWINWFRSGHFVRRLMQESGDIDLQVVKAEKASIKAEKSRWHPAPVSTYQQYALAAGVVLATGLVSLPFVSLDAPRVPGLIFLLVVVLLALFVGRGPVLFAGALSALTWNFFFLPPRFTFIIRSLDDAILFGTYFVVAIVLGQLVARIRAQSEAERRREERTGALYELTRELAEAGSRDEVVWQLLGQTNRVFHAPAAVAFPVGDKLAPHPDNTLALTEKELSVSDWAFRQRKAAGRFTDNLPGASAIHLPLATERKTFGVLAVGLSEPNLPLAQRELLEAYARQAALVLDRVELRAAAEQTRLFAESERLSRALLNSISHELRIPLAAITSAATALSDTFVEPGSRDSTRSSSPRPSPPEEDREKSGSDDASITAAISNDHASIPPAISDDDASTAAFMNVDDASNAACKKVDAAKGSGEQRRALLGEIQEANARLNRIVGNLLDVARLESGKVVPRLDWHDARDLVQTTLRELKREMSRHPVKLELPPEPTLVRLDFSLAQHALANLLVNAANHTPAGTPVEVRAKMADSSLFLSVADRGPGISPELLPRVFAKFFRAPNAPPGGSGLGLTIAKGFVEAQGGTVSVENRAGVGAIFTIRLPQSEQPPTVEPG